MSNPNNAKKGPLKILFTCVGRRVTLLESFRSSARELGLDPIIIGTDATELSPALQLCDKKFVVPLVDDANYIETLESIVDRERVDLIVPTVDLDLKVLALHSGKLKEIGCTVLVSNADVIEICQDKRKTYEFMTQNGFDTPQTRDISEAISCSEIQFPCFLKPWDGYASRGNAIVHSREELSFYASRIPNCIVQELVLGTEYTCDVYVDFQAKVRCVVPRKRIQVRAGEVSKGQVIKNENVIKSAAKVVETLGAGPGVITLQLFVGESGRIVITEVNPRFGGGVPLSIKAGADFPKWILQELVGQKPDVKMDAYKDKLIMLRYDAEVWLEG